MKNILHIISSTRGEESVSTQLGNAIVEKLRASDAGILTTTDLEKFPLSHLNASRTIAMRTPQDLRTAEQTELLKESDQAVATVFAADIIVISTPLINFSIPSSLKAWLDNIARAGVTFSYSAEGAKGLVTGKKVYIALASGAIYSEGPMQPYDHAVPYLKSMLSFIGMTDITVLRAEGTSIPGIQDIALEKAIESFAVAV
ncbi:FMN-dependent NADH-azoreductase [Flavobacterium rivuli WB 3.3-2 = DSM 21788]|uniref:FMN dependent NADH:quinone oxidoreductase n=1 Tax=Flavobacterium rivuli WB 3.3-2 = DSM 21788 TaxID=1121895 RepID=A0A0A2LY77_9FLAO|nr:NAD(P)H-dependent oxidoreductase [Flavobacterium rivuli]KGO85342.1 FMN-dependent NADH-azoreductase [Flavobacterium rivuli WB 3.3-2 = DSM 21788]